MTPKERIHWNEYEVDELAKKWVEMRAKDPFERAAVLLNAAQSILPEHRRKHLLTTPRHVRIRIVHFWNLRDRPTCQAEPPQPAPPPGTAEDLETQPIIIEVEKEKPVDFPTLVQKLDIPTLFAVLAAKVGSEFALAREQLESMNARLSSRPVEIHHRPAPHPIAFLHQAPAKPRTPRIALVGPLQHQWREIEAELQKAKLPVEVRWTSKDKLASSAFSAVDYAIVTRHTNHKWWDAARNELASSRVFFQEQTGVSSIVQRIRDIASMQRPS